MILFHKKKPPVTGWLFHTCYLIFISLEELQEVQSQK